MRITILLCFCINFFIVSYSQQADSSTISAYLREHMEAVDLEKQLPLRLLEKDISDNALFLFGENHGSADPQLADLLLFKQLHQQAGVRHYIAEVDVVKAWMLNNYLKDGNEQWLQKVFKSWVADTAQWANKSNYAKFQQLRAYYSKLPVKEKFTVLGIDVLQDYSLLKEYTSFLLKDRRSKILQPYLDSLLHITDTIQYANRKRLGEFARRLLPKLQAAAPEVNKTFAANGPAMLHYVTSLSFISAGMYRDSIMYRNMQSLLAVYSLQQKKMYGFLGFYHCLQAGYEKSMPFAAQLQHNKTIFSGKIISIQMLALQSKTLLPYVSQVKQMMPKAYADKLRNESADFKSEKYIPYELSNDAQMMRINGIDFLKQLTKPGTLTLFHLNAPGSPFANSKLLAEVTGFQTIRLTNPLNSTTNAFQYVLLFRNSKAGIPIE